MYSIQMYRPNSKSSYLLKVRTLSDAAAIIMKKRQTIDTVLNLTNKEKLILFKKCYAIAWKEEYSGNKKDVYENLYKHQVYRILRYD